MFTEYSQSSVKSLGSIAFNAPAPKLEVRLTLMTRELVEILILFGFGLPN